MHAQPAASTTQSPADTAAINAIVDALTAAWNQGDAHAFAAHYAADGSFTNILGTTLFGREGFEAQHHMIFTTIYKGSHVTFSTDRIHFLRPDVAIADVTSHLAGVAHFPGNIQPDPDGAIRTKLQLVPTQNAGTWQIDAFHNVAVINLPPRP